MKYEDVIELLNSTEEKLTVCIETPIHENSTVPFEITGDSQTLASGSVTFGCDENGDPVDEILELLLDKNNFEIREYRSLVARSNRT